MNNNQLYNDLYGGGTSANPAAPANSGTNPSPTPTPVHSMKWHKFLIYFTLWAAAVIAVLNAAQLFLGTHYGDQASVVYMVYPSIKSLDFVFGVLYILLAVWAVVTRFKLAGYSRSGPTMLTAYYVLGLILSLAYLLMCSLVTNEAGMFGELLVDSSPDFVGSIIMIIVNHQYYQKRRKLFCK